MMNGCAAGKRLVSALILAMSIVGAASGKGGKDGHEGGAEGGARMTLDARLKGYDIAETGLTPKYPDGFECSPLTSLYASWIDVDGSRRDERHSGIDGGRLGDAILAPAPGTVRRVWVADWGQGHEGALLMLHTHEDLNLPGESKSYYVEYDHLRYDDIKDLKAGQRIARGEHLANVFRPGGKSFFLPEVHFEVWEVGDDAALTWKAGEHGTEYFDNATARLIDPLYMLSREIPPDDALKVEVQPYDPKRDYKGFTYFLPCRKHDK